MSIDRLDRMDAKLDRVESKVDRTSEDIGEINTSIAKLEVHMNENKEDWKAHMSRTDYNERRILRLEKIEQWLRGATWITLGLGSLLLVAIKYFNS